MTKEEFLVLASQKWEELSENQEKMESFYDYEKNFDALWTDLGRQVLEGSLEGPSVNESSKKKHI